MPHQVLKVRRDCMGTQVRVIMRLRLPYNRSCTITSTIDNAMGQQIECDHETSGKRQNRRHRGNILSPLWLTKLITSELFPLRTHLQCVTKAT
jgi:hypothetical protein